MSTIMRQVWHTRRRRNRGSSLFLAVHYVAGPRP